MTKVQSFTFKINFLKTKLHVWKNLLIIILFLFLKYRIIILITAINLYYVVYNCFQDIKD